ncbi:MAG: ATP synthase F1 subunit delta, partial [Duncaniella sp.]|nr:ATP synthase F1 subunit delta [Duncaniella sp.]
IPSRYSKAIYEAAAEKKADGRMFELMKNLASAFDKEAQLSKVMANPFVSAADKSALLMTAAQADPDKDTLFADSLRLLAENGRLDMAREIALAFVKLYREKHSIKLVTVTSAAPMSPEETDRLKRLIASHIGEGSMEFEQRVDPELIGGFAVKIGNEKLDASVAAELKALRLKLT